MASLGRNMLIINSEYILIFFIDCYFADPAISNNAEEKSTTQKETIYIHGKTENKIEI